MSGICGYFGEGDPAWLAAMLGAISYRGDTNSTCIEPRYGFGYRFWQGRPGKAQEIYTAADGARTVAAGTLAPMVVNPAASLDERLRRQDFADLDGAFCAARVNTAREELTLL